MTKLTHEQVFQIIASARGKNEKPEIFSAGLSEVELRQAKLSEA
jgi:hypothetical protein